MRLPVTPQISTKDGVSAKNARLTNCLKESKKGGDKAVIRPGLVLDATASGVGHGLVVFDNNLVSVYGSTLGFGVIEGVDGWTLVNNVVSGSGGGEICYENGMFYILDYYGYFFTTTDLTDIVERTFTGGGITSFGLTAGNGVVLIIPGSSSSGDTADVLWSSDDGDTWNLEPDAIADVWGGPGSSEMHFDGTYFIVNVESIGDNLWYTYRSTDGISWNACGSILSDSQVTAFATGLGYTYAIAGGMGCAYSTNHGLTWTTHPTLDATRDVGNMILSNSTLVAIGDIGGVPYIYRSTDGVTFSETNMTSLVGGGGSPNFLSLITGLLVLTISTINYYTSADDGVSWTANIDSSGAFWNQTAYGGGYTISLEQSSAKASVLGAATSGSIPALTTITGDYYDFAQSPI